MADTVVDLVNEANELACVVIPVAGELLLLPNVCVAEIVPWRKIKILDGSPEWCLGTMDWRGLTLPVINYVAFAGKEKPMQTPRCLVVMNRARTPNGVEFYALSADSLPRMIQLVEGDLAAAADDLCSGDAIRVSFGREGAIVPDLAYIESQVSDLVNELKVVSSGIGSVNNLR